MNPADKFVSQTSNSCQREINSCLKSSYRIVVDKKLILIIISDNISPINFKIRSTLWAVKRKMTVINRCSNYSQNILLFPADIKAWSIYLINFFQNASFFK